MKHLKNKLYSNGTSFMKAVIFFTILCTLKVANGQDQNYTVTLKLRNAKNTDTADLLYYNETTPVFTKAGLKDGEYTFKGSVPYPVTANVFMNGKGFGYVGGKFPDKISIYLESGNINIIAEDSIKNAKVIGGQYNDDYSKYKKFLNKEAATMEYNNGTTIIAIQNKAPKSEVDSLRTVFANGILPWRNRNIEYARTHPNSYSSIYALTVVLGSHPDETVFQPVFDSLSSKVKSTVAGQKLEAMLNASRNTEVGSYAPEFIQNDTAGKPVSLKDFRGKYVLIDFWASWCGPCRAENPNYVRSYNKYRSKGFDMIGISLDNSNGKENWLNAIHKDGLKWTQVSDLNYWKNAVAVSYGIRAIPQNFLIDPNGKIIATNLRGDDLEKELNKIFK